MKLRLPWLPEAAGKKARDRKAELFDHLDGRCSATCPHCARGEK